MKTVFTLISLFFGLTIFAQKDFSASHIIKKTDVVKNDAEPSPTMSGLFESFETTVPPTGWTKANPDGGSGWSQVADETDPLPGWTSTVPMTIPSDGGSKAAYCTWNTGGSTDNDQWLITPPLAVESGDILSFWIWHYSSYADNVQVLLSSSDNNTTSFTEVIADLNYNTTTDWTEHTYDLSAYAGKTIYIAFRDVVADNQNEGGFVAIDLVQVVTMESVDLSLVSLSTPTYAPLGEVDITGHIINNGSDNITSFDVSYNIGGGTESVAYSVTGVNIPLGDTYDFTHNIPHNFNTSGTFEINVTVSNVNGGGENNLGDNVLSKSIIVYLNSVQRKVVLENFTTGQCPNCPPIHVLLENYVENEKNAILIAQHAGYYTDEMTIPENEELLSLYGGGTYAPALTIDRHYYKTGLTGGTAEPGPVFWPGESTSATTTRIDERLNVPAFVTLDIRGDYNAKGTLELDVSGELIGDVFGNDLRLAVYILEDSLIYSQAGGGSNYVHNNVMRDAVSGTWGDPGIINFNVSGTSFSKHYSYTTDQAWNKEKLHIVVFVANYDNDIKNREILNAERVKLTALIPSEITLTTSPFNGETNVSVLSDVLLKFNQTMRLIDNNPVTNANVLDFVHLSDPAKGNLSFSAFVNNNNNEIRIMPDIPFSELTTITVTVDGNKVENVLDEVFAGNVSSFTTDTYPLASVNFNPSNGSQNVSIATDITLTFGSLMRKKDNSEITDADISSFVTLTDPSKGSIPYTGSINPEKTIITINPDENLNLSADITVTIAGDVIENQFDNVLGAASSTFTTAETSTVLPSVSDRLNVFPNPSNGTVFISGAENTTLTVVDVFGKTIFKKLIKSKLDEINVNTFPSGIYVLIFDSPGFIFTEKLIVVKK